MPGTCNSPRPLVFLFPNERLDVGGNSAQLRFVQACGRFTQTSVVYYEDCAKGGRDFDELVASISREMLDPVFVIHWGPDVDWLLTSLQGRDIVYFAHSTGWGISLPERVPILCVSRHTQAYWGRHSPNSNIFHVPNIIGAGMPLPDACRDIDVLVQTRKSSDYLLDRLVPALREHCRVTVLDDWVDDLPAWLRRSRVYLYDSLDHWISVGATEGFGLPPLEALAEGCIVFSSVNDALSDYLDPGFNCRKIRVHSLHYDVDNVLRALKERHPRLQGQSFLEPYAFDAVSLRLEAIFLELERFFEITRGKAGDIGGPGPMSLTLLQRAKKVIRTFAA